MDLPRLVLLADGFARHSHSVLDAVQEAVGAGLRWVHLRDHEVAPEVFHCAAQDLLQHLHEPALLVSINTCVEVAEALDTGIHVGTRGPSISDIQLRPRGFSAHTPEEAYEAAEQGADYVFASPIFPTSSKPDQPGLGSDGLRAFAEADVPVFALGGVTPERVAACLNADAYGVAVLSGILHAPSPFDATRRYLRALDRHPS